MMQKLDLKQKTIVVFYMLYFGDMVSITPFLEVLRREAKGSRIILVIDQRFAESVQYNPNIDELVPVDRRAGGLSASWKLGRQLRDRHPDILFVLHGTTRTFLMGLAMHPKWWTGEAGTRLDHFFMDQELLVERKDCHAAEKYLRVLQDIGVEDLSHHGMQTFTGPAWETAAEAFFHKQGIRRGEKLAGFSVGSSTKEKNWPAENYGEVADYFAEKGYIPVFFGVTNELPLIEAAVGHMKWKEKAVIAAGKLSMGEFMAAASWCDVGFTNDSGPMYVFDSRGVPTIAMFGPSNARLHHPIGQRSCALSSSDLPLTQDHVRHTIRDKTYIPIERIPVEEVIRAGKWALGLREDKRYAKHYCIISS